MSKQVNKFYDITDNCYKYYNLHGMGQYFHCYEDALRDELIGLGILIPHNSDEIKENWKMSKVLDYLMKDDVKIVFDVDGVLAPFEFGELKHNGCKDEDWEKFVIENKPYDIIKAIPQLKQFINNKGLNNIYACSVSAPYEEQNKRDFVVREYGIPVENIKFVSDKKDKIHFLKQLVKETNDESKVAIVEDTVSTLNQIFDNTDFITVHISSFFFY